MFLKLFGEGSCLVARPWLPGCTWAPDSQMQRIDLDYPVPLGISYSVQYGRSSYPQNGFVFHVPWCVCVCMCLCVRVTCVGARL